LLTIAQARQDGESSLRPRNLLAGALRLDLGKFETSLVACLSLTA
jgi:hypothetical protein